MRAAADGRSGHAIGCKRAGARGTAIADVATRSPLTHCAWYSAVGMAGMLYAATQAASTPAATNTVAPAILE
jgi:hypothetical protein